MWYTDCFRRHLCDMHIDDWNDDFLKEFSPETYVENLKTARIQNAMIYLQSHVGYCYYPTKTGRMHRAFLGREDAMRRLIALCHENGIYVTGYYSLIYNTYEHDRHPSWQMKTPDGRSRRCGGSSEGQALAFAAKRQRYGLCCPNNGEYTRFVLAQIDELLSGFDCDALFFDMPFWTHTCYCDSCRARWRSEVGGDLPVDPPAGSPDYLVLADVKYRWMGQWVQSLRDYIKEKAPQLPVEFNFAEGIAGNSQNGCGAEVGSASDYAGGDLYGGLYEQSLTCKFYRNITKHQPFEYMFSRCKPTLQTHTLTKSPVEMASSVMLTAAHHGATLVIDAIDPVGTMDARVYRRIGEVFAAEAQYEPFFRGELLEDVGIYYGIRSKFNAQGEPYTSISGAVGLTSTLIHSHIPFGVTGSFHRLEGYQVLAAPALSALERADHPRLLRYVADGGTLYLSGTGDRELVETLLDAEVTGRTEETLTYLAPLEPYEALLGGFNARYPLPFNGTAPLVALKSREGVAATLTLPYTKPSEARFASIHSNPPGVATDYPMLVIRKFGKGTVIWSAVCLESNPMDEYREIVRSLLLLTTDSSRLSFTSDAPGNVEITAFSDGRVIDLHAVALADGADAPFIRPYRVRVRTASAPRSLKLLPSGRELPFTYDGTHAAFSVDAQELFLMFRLEL